MKKTQKISGESKLNEYKKILFLGYYGHLNMGDDYFEFMFRNIFKNYSITFANPNKIDKIPEDTDILICGGGDIINDYFMLKICELKKNFGMIPTYAISVGVTYKLSFHKGKSYYLDIFDYFIVRNKIDAIILGERYGPEYVKYLPDIVHGITKFDNNKLSFSSICNYFTKKPKIIGIFLTNTIYNKGLNENYNNQIKNFVDVIESLPTEYIIHMVPFNIGKNPNENDIIINDNIYELLTEETKKRTRLQIYTQDELLNSFVKKTYTVGLCMRYHSHILSYTYKIPFISISMTNKTLEYMKDMNITKYFINYAENPLLDKNIIIKLLHDVIKDKTFFKKLTINLNDYMTPIINEYSRNTGPLYFDNMIFNKLFSDLVSYILNFIFDDLKIKEYNIEEIIIVFNQTYRLNDIIKIYGLNIPKNYNILITDIIMFHILKTFKTEYNYGLERKIFTCNLKENIHWIYENIYYKGMNRIYNHSTNLNFSYINNYFDTNIHRSGWHYVSKKLLENYNDNAGDIIVDLYIDRTFLWDADINIKLKKIPYTRPWIGFIHHTPNPEYTDHSLNHIFDSELFKSSLEQCKGLIVLSDYLKVYLENNFKTIKIYKLTHPTELPNIYFSFDNFNNNKEKKIIQIGGWLRNSYAIYNLKLNNKKLNIAKYILNGKHMENYIKPTEFKFNSINNLFKEDEQHEYNICTVTNNKFINFLIKHLDETYNEVNIIDYVDNEAYDYLLSNNIVFLNLINASACNTLIECIIRNTPIIINRLPAIEEVLGKNYPLYYDNISEANNLVSNINIIKDGYNYLKKMDKTKLTIEYFLKEFNKIVIEINKEVKIDNFIKL